MDDSSQPISEQAFNEDSDSLSPDPSVMVAEVPVAMAKPSESSSDEGPHTPWESITPDAAPERVTDGQRPALVMAADGDFPNGEDSRPVKGGGLLTIPLLCLGIAVIACCILIPQADSNREVAYERFKLQRDLEQLQKQGAINDQFLKTLGEDPTLAERLAQRQMKLVREGTTTLDLKGEGKEDLSPFLLVKVDPPAPLPPYRPVGGAFVEAFRNARFRLYAIGAGLLMIATGLVLGSTSKD
jgi:hypothetical protein